MTDRTKRADQIATLPDNHLDYILRSSRVIDKAQIELCPPLPQPVSMLPLHLPGPGGGFLIEDQPW